MKTPNVNLGERPKKNSDPKIESFLDQIRAGLDPALVLSDDWKLSMQRLDARSDEVGTVVKDLAKCWLPPNGVYPRPQRMTEQPKFAACLILAVNVFWMRSRSEKSRHRHAEAIFSNICKFLEYTWLCNKFDLSTWSEEEYAHLAKLLAAGGWQHALKIKSRFISYCDRVSGAELNLLLRADGGKQQKCLNSSLLQASLGTNVNGREPKIYMACIKQVLLAKTAQECDDKLIEKIFSTSKKYEPSQSMLRQIFEAINYLYDLPLVGVSLYPYRNAYKLAQQLGKPHSRTKNLAADEASKLLWESYRWIYHFGPALSKLMADLCDAAIRADSESLEPLGYYLEGAFEASAERKWLSENLPTPLNSIDMPAHQGVGLSVRGALLCLMSACFVIIATMNARRRDEIAHRRFGIHRGFISVVNEELCLYVGDFYIEKTYCDYLSFYVNQVTLDASRILEEIQTSFDNVDRALGRRDVENIHKREQSLFSYRRLSRKEGVGFERCWFQFETRSGCGARNFVDFALGTGAELKPNPHMFRRFYALISYYQYSNATLQSLKQQLAHRSLSTTLVYVTDPAFIDDAKRIGSKIKDHLDQKRRAFELHGKAVRKELKIVSDAMLVETVLDIISGEPAIGTYSKFIRHVYSRFAKRLDFDSDDLLGTAKEISKLVSSRGHAPTPMPHGQCMVGNASGVHLARCKNPSANILQKELASPAKCANCFYHHSNENYLRNLREDLTKLNLKAISGSVLEKENARREAENLALLIQLHDKRLASDIAEQNWQKGE